MTARGRAAHDPSPIDPQQEGRGALSRVTWRLPVPLVLLLALATRLYRVTWRLPVPLVLLLALATRLYRVDGQSLWYDEGASVALAQRDVATIIQSAAGDIHPPLYYIVLRYWVQIFGTGEIAVRLLSVLAGVAVVYVTYLLGRRLFGARVGLLAALLAALSPFQVYYSQEARMYILATLLSALSVYLLWSLLTTAGQTLRVSKTLRVWPARREGLLWLAYVLVTVAALYTHYFAATVVLAQDAAIILALGWRTVIQRRAGQHSPYRPALHILAAQVVVALLYVPWLPVMTRQFANWPAISEFYNLPALVGRLFPIFSLGLSIDAPEMLAALLVFAAALLVGLLPTSPPSPSQGERRGEGESPTSPPSPSQGEGRGEGQSPASPPSPSKGEGRGEGQSPASPPSPSQGEGRGEGEYLLAASWLLIPILTMFVLSLRRPNYNPKFLLVATPAFYLLLARGLALAWTARVRLHYLKKGLRIVVAGALLVLCIDSLVSLKAYYTDPAYARDDYRGLVHTVQAGQREGDAIILNAPGQVDIFGYYYKGNLPVYPLPRQRPLDEQATTSELATIAQSHQRLWVVYYGDQQADPRRVIESWLDGHVFKASDRWYGNVRLALYARPTTSAAEMQPLNVRFGGSVELLGYQLQNEEQAAGDIIPLTLYWKTSQVLPDRYTVFAHIIDTHNTLWGQRDGEPGGGLRPTTTWQPGEVIQDNYGLPVLSGTPPGSYRIEIGMYRPDTGLRLQITDGNGKSLGDRILIEPLAIVRPQAPPPLNALGMQHTSSASFGGMRLLGYNLTRLGEDRATSEFAPGEVLHLSLFWQATAAPLSDMVVTVRIAGAGPALEHTARPADGDYPTTQWQVGDVVRDQMSMPLPQVKAGRYSLSVVVRDAEGKQVGEVKIGGLTVR